MSYHIFCGCLKIGSFFNENKFVKEQIDKLKEEVTNLEMSDIDQKIKDFQNKIDGFKNKNQDSPE